MWLSSLFLVAFLLLILKVIRTKIIGLKIKKLPYPPGPFKIPLVGFMPLLAFSPHKVLSFCTKIYGNIYTIFLGNYRVVVLNEWKLIKEAFQNDDFSGRPDLLMLKYRNRGSHKGLVCSEGKTWVEQRKFTIKHLKELGFGKKSMENILQDEIDELIQRIKAEEGKSINLSQRFSMVVLNALWKITAGERFSHDDERLQKIIERTGADLADTAYTGPVLFLPWLIKFLPKLTRWNSFLESIEEVHNFLKNTIDEHKKSIEINSSNYDFIHSYLKQIEKETEKESSFYQEKGEHSLLIVLLDLFMAGGDTQSTTLSWIFLYLVIYPKNQEKIQSEIHNVIGCQRPSYSDRKLMPFTEAVILEVFRKSSLVPMGLFHSVRQDTYFSGYFMPKDTVIVANLYNVHHDEKYWKNPHEFYPFRFLDEKNQMIRHDSFMPFSTGKRACPGESLSKDQIFLIVVSLLQKFTFKTPTNEKPPSQNPKIGVILSPQPYNVICTSRNC